MPKHVADHNHEDVCRCNPGCPCFGEVQKLRKAVPHVHSEVIKAWADGAEIEIEDDDGWRFVSSPAWDRSRRYRIKLDPIVEEAAVLCGISGGVRIWEYNVPNVRFTFDPNTRDLIGVELLTKK